MKNKLSLLSYETRKIPQKNMEVMKDAILQGEEVASEVTRKLQKQEKKCFKKKKKWLAAISFTSSENISSTPEEHEKTSKRPKKEKKKKLQKSPLYPNPRKRNLFQGGAGW